MQKFKNYINGAFVESQSGNSFKTIDPSNEKEFAENPSYVDRYRFGNAYHGAHPFFMWYWGEGGRQWTGRVIAAGATNSRVPELMGWETAENLSEAIAMAKSTNRVNFPSVGKLLLRPKILLTLHDLPLLSLLFLCKIGRCQSSLQL